MQNQQTRHRVSDQLKDRHPYDPTRQDNAKAFAKGIKCEEVSIAYGNRSIPKLLTAIRQGELCFDKLDLALSYLLEETKSQESRIAAMNYGVIGLCPPLLVHNAEAVRIKTLKLLNNMVRFNKANTFPHFANCITSVIQNFNHQSSHVRTSSLHTFSTYVSTRSGRRDALRITESTESLIQALPDNESNIANYYGLLALAHITKEIAAVQVALDLDCSQVLVELLKEGDENTVEFIAAVVCNFGVTNTGKTKAVEAGLVPLLAQKISPTVQVETKRKVSSALLSLSIIKNGKVALGEDEIVELLCIAINDLDKNVQMNLMAAIKTASEHLPTKKRYIRRLLENDGRILDIYGDSCASCVLELLDEPDVELRKQVMKCLVGLVKKNDAVKTLYCCIYSIERIGLMLGDSDEMVRDAASKVMKSMLGVDINAKKRLISYLNKQVKVGRLSDVDSLLKMCSD